MINLIILFLMMIPLFIVVKKFVIKNSEQLLKINPYIQPFVAIPIISNSPTMKTGFGAMA